MQRSGEFKVKATLLILHPIEIAMTLKIRFRLFADQSGSLGDPLTTVEANNRFFIQILLEDARSGGTGIIGFATDLSWDPNRIESLNAPFTIEEIVTANFPSADGKAELGQSRLEGGALPEFGLGQAIGANQSEPFATLHFLSKVKISAADFTLTPDPTSVAYEDGSIDNPPVIPSPAKYTENSSEEVLRITDPDPDATVVAMMTGGADQGQFTLDAATGSLTFRESPDFETPSDADGDNVYQVQITAYKDFLLTVVDGNSSDSATVTYTLVGGADQSLFELDSTTGQLSFKQAPDFSTAVDADGDNVYEVQIAVTTVDSIGEPVTAVLREVRLSNLNLQVLDVPTTLALSPSAISQVEGNSELTAFVFTVARSGDLSGTVSVDWNVTGLGLNAATAEDFSAGVFPSERLIFADGEATKDITVYVRGDNTVEQNETFTLTLSNPSSGVTITSPIATGTLQNDDTTLAISPTTATQPEGNSGVRAFTFTVTRSGWMNGTTSVDWSVIGSGSNAADASDFGGSLPSGSVTFAAGETSRAVTVNVSGDSAVELDETFAVTLSNPSGGATLTTAIAQGTIQNDDVPSISVSTVSLSEGDFGTQMMRFVVSLSSASSQPVSVNYTTQDGTAIAGSDFIATAGTLTFAAGETSRTVTVPVLGDLAFEGDEAFSLVISLPTNAVLGSSIATGRILNDDASSNVVTEGSNVGDRLTGSRSSDILSGGAGDDRIDGGMGNDTLIGGVGNDILVGGSGNDVLCGVGASNGSGEIDRLQGGSGSDTFVLGNGETAFYLGGGSSDYAVITDFDRVNDTIVLSGQASQYRFEATASGLQRGTGIYQNADLIGIIANLQPTAIPAGRLFYLG